MCLNFRGWLWNCEICVSFLPQKFPAIYTVWNKEEEKELGEEALSHWHYKNTLHLNNYKDDCDLLDLRTFPSHTGVLQRTQCPSQSWLSCHPASYHWCILLHSQPTDENNILWLTVWVKEPAPLDIVEVSVILAVRIILNFYVSRFIQMYILCMWAYVHVCMQYVLYYGITNNC